MTKKKQINSRKAAPINLFVSRLASNGVLSVKRVVIFFLIIFFVSFVTYSLSQWGSEYHLTPPPAADSPSLLNKRQRAHDEISSAFSTLDSHMPFQKYSSGTHDRCGQGQKNYEVHDSYSNKCEYKVTEFYGFDGEFREQMTILRDYLVSNHWMSARDVVFPQEDSIDSLLVHYYDEYKNQETNFHKSKVYRVCDLPTSSVAYNQNELNLGMKTSEQDECDQSDFDFYQEVSNSRYLSSTEFYNILIPAEGINDILARHKYLIAIAIEKTYFEVE
jgi:hypothetical protein